MNIKSFENTDLDALERLYLNSRKDAFYWMDQQLFTLNDFVEDTKNEKIYVAKENNEIMGFISIYEEENFIHHLFVDKNYKNKGVGKSLLDFAKNLYFPMKLKCYSKNFLAISFYKKYGFEIVSKEKDIHLEDYYLMELK